MLASLLAIGGLPNNIKSLRDLRPKALGRAARPWIDRASARVNADVPVLEALL